MEELIKLQKEYIEFLGDCYNNAYLMANLHHYTESDANIKIGEILRNGIKALEQKLATGEGQSNIPVVRVMCPKCNQPYITYTADEYYECNSCDHTWI